MARRSAEDIYRQLLAAGFDPASATIGTAIALAESGGDDATLGDVNLQDATWGPSYGLWQIRTVKAQTGTGTDRDIVRLTGDDAAQARAAYQISRGGLNWGPWTVFSHGTYTAFLGQARAAAAAVSGAAADIGGGLGGILTGGAVGGVGTGAAGLLPDKGKVLGDARAVLIEAIAAAFGGGLVVLGAYLLAKRFSR